MNVVPTPAFVFTTSIAQDASLALPQTIHAVRLDANIPRFNPIFRVYNRSYGPLVEDIH